jgi:uncharacterized membrane protein
VLKVLLVYGAILATFCVGDFIWLGWVAKDLYRRYMGDLMLPTPNWPAAVAFYLLYAAAVQIFTGAGDLAPGSIGRAVAVGALLGFACYMTYDLSNLATLKGWSTTLAVVDIVWGTVLTAVAAAAGYFARQALSS